MKIPRRQFRPENLLERLLRTKNVLGRNSIEISEREVIDLCKRAQRSFRAQPCLLEIPADIKICGDIHGQYFDLLKLFNLFGRPSEHKYLFLGDYVDRGRNSLESICLLLTLKVLYPDSFFMIRGNHEFRNINKKYGFYSEMKRRFKRRQGIRVYNQLNRIFDYMPIAALVDEKIFCCHGGLGPELKHLDQIRQLQRPIRTLDSDDWVSDILWSDPADDIERWEKMDDRMNNERHRGKGYLFGKEALEVFLKNNHLELLCRSHQCVENGYKWSLGKKLVTIFSAPNYCSKGNQAAIIEVTRNEVIIKQFW